MSSFFARARRYAREVVKGKIPTGKWTQLACQRQLEDLKRWRGKAAPYRFDKAAGERICAFVECLPHIKGEWAKRGESIRLEDWQCFILTTIFGWLRRDGLRRLLLTAWLRRRRRIRCHLLLRLLTRRVVRYLARTHRHAAILRLTLLRLIPALTTTSELLLRLLAGACGVIT